MITLEYCGLSWFHDISLLHLKHKQNNEFLQVQTGDLHIDIFISIFTWRCFSSKSGIICTTSSLPKINVKACQSIFGGGGLITIPLLALQFISRNVLCHSVRLQPLAAVWFENSCFSFLHVQLTDFSGKCYADSTSIWHIYAYMFCCVRLCRLSAVLWWDFLLAVVIIVDSYKWNSLLHQCSSLSSSIIHF